MRHKLVVLCTTLLSTTVRADIGRECEWSVADLLMESSSRALLHYCLATSPASEEMVNDYGDIKTPSAVIEKFCHSTGALNRFHSAIMNILDGAWHPSKQSNTKSDYDFLVTLTDNIKDRNYIIAQRKIGNYVAELYNRVAMVNCPTSDEQRMIMTGAETLFSQLRGIVGNTNFAHLFGLKTIAKPSIHMSSNKPSSKLTMTRAGLRLPTDRPVALYMSSSEAKAKLVKLGLSNHADLDTIKLYSMMNDVQPRSSVFIISATSLPAINDQLLAFIGAAQTNHVRVNVITVDPEHISTRSADLYSRIATLTSGHSFESSSAELFHFIPLIEYSLMENQALILSRTVPSPSARFHLPTDTSMTGITILSTCPKGSPSIRIFEPSGTAHHEYVQLTRVGSLSFWLVENIAVGDWSVDVTCPLGGPITFEAASESSINFEIESESDNESLVVKSLFIPTLKLAHATLNSGSYSPVSARLGTARLKKSGSNADETYSPVSIDYDWMPNNADVELSSSLLAPLELEQKSMDLFLTPTQISGPLMSKQIAKVTATDEDGATVQREVPVFEKQLELKDDVAAIDFQPGSTVYVTLKVNNNNEVMHLTATDFEGWVDSVSPSTTRAEDSYSLVKVKVTAPADARIGHETQVTVTARDNSLNRLNAAKFTLAVGQTENPEVKKMLVDSKIENRFGRTIVQSKVVNSHQNPRDAVFSVFLPDSAFITSYQLYIRNHTFKAEIIEPKHLEHPTDWVTPSTVTMEDEHEWRVKVRMDSWDEALFELIYDQSITKSNGKYPYKVNLKGRQDIEDVDIKVALYDEDGIADVAVISEQQEQGIQQRGFGDFGLGGGEGLMGGVEAEVNIDSSRKSATISFNPTQNLFDEMSRSQGFSDAEPEPLEEAKFNMEYEVDTLVGDDFCTITAQGDYFVQFCNPPLPTLVADNATLGEYHYDVILMLDTSGSMFGEKINHAIDALKNIINKLPEGDQFNIVRYGNRVRSWRTGFSSADEKNAEKAAEFLDNITVGGSTDIEGALLEAISMAESSENGRIPIILFLTDGGPNVGGNDIQTIVSNISNRAGYGISINGISLGTNDLNGWQLVQRLAAKNRGLSAKYFDIGSFPTEIPKKFAEMREHARSLRGLSDINFKMNGQYVHELTNTHFADYAEGSDLVVLGKLTDATVDAVPFTLEYTDVEGTKWTEQKIIKVRQVNTTEEEDRFTAGQADYNPIKQQWAVTAVHQILERRAQAQSEEEYNLLTQEAKSLSYKYQIVSPVVSFLVRKPKSSLNLIDSRLEERERRSTPQETHEIRYQYRKLMWRPNQQDGLEAAETVMASLLAQDTDKENAQDDNNMWLALGSSPLMAFYKLNNYMDSRACLNLPDLSGSFKLIQFSDSVVEGTINKGRLERVSITSSEGQLDVADGKVTLTKDEDSINLEKEDEFNLGPWVAQRSGASLHIINHDQSLSLIVTPIDDRIDIEISGALEHTQGLLEEFAQLDVQLIEKQGKKQVTQTTLLINDQFVPAESVVVDSYDEKSLTTRCWRVEAKQTSKLLH